jgi:hypothetical protein
METNHPFKWEDQIRHKVYFSSIRFALNTHIWNHYFPISSNNFLTLAEVLTDTHTDCTDKKENQILLIYKEIQNGAVAKSYVTSGLLMYGEIFAHFLIY